MLRAAWSHVKGDLASTWRGAAAFRDDLESIYGASNRRNWIARWTNIGDAHCLVGGLNTKNGTINEATEALGGCSSY